MASLARTITRIGIPSGDQFLGTHNVRDIMDTANDMLFGIVGATVFVLVYKGTEWYQLKRAHPRGARRRRS